MNPKLKVWMLHSEYRNEKVQGEKQLVKVLVLRDEHGKVKQVAKTKPEEKELLKLYDRYNKTTKTQDLPVSPRLRKKIALTVADLKKHGFIYRQLCYGTRVDRKTGKREYKRMEVFKTTPWKQRERQRIWGFFKWHVPKDNIGIYVIQNNKLFKRHLNFSN